MSSDIELEKIQHLLESANSAIDSNNPTARCLGAEFVDKIAGVRCWRAIPHFHEHAHQFILEEAKTFLKRIKDEYDFHCPGFVFNQRSDDQRKQDSLANRPLYLEMYRVFVLGEAPDSSNH